MKIKKKKNKLKERNWWLIFHLISTVLFLGGSFTQWLLLMTAIKADTAEVLSVSHYIMHTVDIALIIPGLLGVIITGIFLSIKTHWGFFKNWWIIAKEIVTLITLGLGTALNFWVQSAIEITSVKGLDALNDPVYLNDRSMIIMSAAIQTSILIFVVIISVIKPWGKRIAKKKKEKQDKEEESAVSN
ncbi:hypothetical protein [Jeotgalibacillus marinus]|uniref:Integral membrane protein n=1 Tax=Jeotgalibacillus marinus TaxID=86667 RepID=A0ABV3Q7S5_9BACL